MNLEPTDEQRGLRDTVRRFVADKAGITTYVRPKLTEHAGHTDTVWAGLVDLGVVGLLVPTEFGGAAATMAEAGVVAEALGASVMTGPWLSAAVAAPRALLRCAAEQAGSELLQGIADGSSLVTVALAAGDPPRARGSGGAAVLHGAVEAVPDAAAADVLLVPAHDGDGTALFAVDATARGVSVRARATVDPTRRVSDATFDGAPARRLSDASDEAVQALRDDLLIAYAADALGAADAVCTLAVEYATMRRQFGKPIGSFQAVQHLCVDMYETVELARSGIIHALWAADAADAAERHLAAVRAKAFAGSLTSVADTAIQVFGGIGFTWEHDAHLYLKRLLGFEAMAGGTDRYLEEVGSRLVSSVTGDKGEAL